MEFFQPYLSQEFFKKHGVMRSAKRKAEIDALVNYMVNEAKPSEIHNFAIYRHQYMKIPPENYAEVDTKEYNNAYRVDILFPIIGAVLENKNFENSDIAPEIDKKYCLGLLCDGFSMKDIYDYLSPTQALLFYDIFPIYSNEEKEFKKLLKRLVKEKDKKYKKEIFEAYKEMLRNSLSLDAAIVLNEIAKHFTLTTSDYEDVKDILLSKVLNNAKS